MIEKGLIFQGKWKDTYLYEDGSSLETDWSPNQMQDTSQVGTARLWSEIVSGEVPAIGGFQYLALGEGDSGWDITPPTKSYQQDILTSELDRIAINPSTDIVYLDLSSPDLDNPLVSGTPTRWVEIVILIDIDRGIDPITNVGYLREFALFGIDATSAVDSGIMLNWVSHNLITKLTAPNPFQILRTIRIKWLTSEEITVV
jgi:hypothetical protein